MFLPQIQSTQIKDYPNSQSAHVHQPASDGTGPIEIFARGSNVCIPHWAAVRFLLAQRTIKMPPPSADAGVDSSS